VSVRCAIGLGANLGQRAQTLERACVELARLPSTCLVARSRWIETEPVGGPSGQGPYLNGAVLLDTELAPRALLERLQTIERVHGRRREDELRHGARTLDLDLLLYGDREVDEPGLRVPHPRMEERLFVLEPLSELCPAMILPRARIPIAERIAALA
jgi:2-amino-4-hydroxy-6-hydroxymethyldihydropteridine diphosphokinase